MAAGAGGVASAGEASAAVGEPQQPYQQSQQQLEVARWQNQRPCGGTAVWLRAELSAVVVRLAAAVRSCRDITMFLPACGIF